MSKSAEAYAYDLPPEAQPAAVDDYNAGRKQALLEVLPHLERLHKVAMAHGEDYTALDLEYTMAIVHGMLAE